MTDCVKQFLPILAWFGQELPFEHLQEVMSQWRGISLAGWGELWQLMHQLQPVELQLLKQLSKEEEKTTNLGLWAVLQLRSFLM